MRIWKKKEIGDYTIKYSYEKYKSNELYLTKDLDEDTEIMVKREKNVFEKLIERVENGEEIYDVQYIAPMVLKGAHENVGYHACWSEDLEKILL